MTKPKFTPGPWKVNGDAEEIKSHDDSKIALLHPGPYAGPYVLRDWSENKANARLIAAAPEMYELLSRVIKNAYGEIDWQGFLIDANDLIQKINNDD